MLTIILSLFSSARQVFQTRAALQAEILALRHQLLVLQRSTRGRRLRLKPGSSVLGMAVSSMEWLAFGGESCKAGDNYRLESQGIPALLDMEESSARWPSANK